MFFGFEPLACGFRSLERETCEASSVGDFRRFYIALLEFKWFYGCGNATRIFILIEE